MIIHKIHVIAIHAEDSSPSPATPFRGVRIPCISGSGKRPQQD